MSDDVRPISAVQPRERRSTQRRGEERRAEAMQARREIVPVEPVVDHEPSPARPAPTPPADASPAAFAAQLLGQSGQKRGLKGGPPVLGAARNTYLGAEYSGPSERRPLPGRATDTDI
ncbi:hypothetical protein [uncultured Brevundimonas sp.]|uniref:hypothetical protein n=1 Tax=uncultured Brevundimonas sp. TaxID=213418 RepID=UPI0025ECE2D4|nr:hypothetical protein [uncultured Brevundimonas sp.]